MVDIFAGETDELKIPEDFEFMTLWGPV